MSGQLASWVSKHYRAGPPEKAVAIQYALVADPHGRATYLLTVDDLVKRTGFKERTVREGRGKAKDDKILRVVEHGGGAGKASRYRVMFTLCPPGVDCPECRELRWAQAPKDGQVRPEKTRQQVQGSRRRAKQKGAAAAGNTAGAAGNTAGAAYQTVDGGRHPPSGGAVPPGESDDAPSTRSPPGARSGRSSDDEPPDHPDHEIGEWHVCRPVVGMCDHGACRVECSRCEDEARRQPA